MLNKKLDEYLNKDIYPFHMPGHKRNDEILSKKLPYKRDLTEITGFDNLNDPKGIFLDMQEKIANLYKVNDALISTNGSTCGILASMRTLAKNNKNILVGRNSHKAVYNAIELFSLDADFVKSKLNKNGIIFDIDYQDLEKKLKEKQYSFLLLTSPTYEGYFLDLDKIHKLCKKYKTYLICDMAHGSHLPLFNDYKKYFSFDLAITSFHKNLSALTPAAAILVNNKNLDLEELKRNMAIFQTSSPSYIICQSIDDMLVNYPKFFQLKDALLDNLKDLYEIDLKNLKLINDPRKDISKILISTLGTNINGRQVQNLLLKEGIEIEMAQANHVVLISTIFDQKKGFERLKDALIKIDKSLKKEDCKLDFENIIAEKKYSISQAMTMKKKKVKLENARNQISAQYIYSYPPGIPILAPGEVFSKEIIENIKKLKEANLDLSMDPDGVFVID